MARIFLCHASEDKPQVRKVYARLKAAGFEPWLDEEEILPGQDWDYEIEQALETCDFVMVFLSTRSVGKTGYVQREFRRALYHSEEMPEGHIHTIPVKLDDCEVPRRFGRHQWANLEEAGAFERIVRALHYGLAQRGLPVPEALGAEPSASELSPASSVSSPFSPARSVPPGSPAPAETERLPEWTNSTGMALVWIPAGTFLMGSPDTDPDARGNEKPAHLVEITQPFYLGKYPVTQAQWEAVMGENPSRFAGHPNRPVESVSWEHVAAFIAKLNEREGENTYGLPTEAQWEYACRAGTEGGHYHEDIGAIAWFGKNSNRETHDVGQKLPNAWGLYDCWVRCGSGLGIGMTATRETLRGIQGAPSRAPTGSFAAVAGATMPAAAVRRLASTSPPASASPTLAFAWRGEYNLTLLPFYPWGFGLASGPISLTCHQKLTGCAAVPNKNAPFWLRRVMQPPKEGQSN